MYVPGTDVNATDSKGVTPLHLALSRLKIMGGGKEEGSKVAVDREEMSEERRKSEEGEKSEVPTFRKKEIMQASKPRILLLLGVL